VTVTEVVSANTIICKLKLLKPLEYPRSKFVDAGRMPKFFPLYRKRERIVWLAVWRRRCRRTQIRSESGLIEDRAIVTAIILMALVNIGGTALLYVEFPRSVSKKMAPGLLVSDDIEPSRLSNHPEMKSCWNVSLNCCSRKSFSCRELESDAALRDNQVLL
jgi:hypothetical protein